MKIAIFADIHARGKDLRALAAQCGQAVGEIRTRDIDIIAFAGDLFDAPNIGDAHASTGGVVAIMQKFIADLVQGGLREMLMIPGNHDMAGVGSADALHVFDAIPGVTIVREAGSLALGTGLTVFCLPWAWNGAPEVELAEGAIDAPIAAPKGVYPTLEKGYDLLLGHVEVIGARMNSRVNCELVPQKWQIFRNTLTDFPARHVALGHFHLRHNLTDGRGGYVGAFRHLNHNDEGNPAGFEIWDSAADETEWIELTAAPRYQTIPVRSHDEPNPSAYDLDGTVTRVDFEIEPDADEIARLEARGVEVRIITRRDERVVRADVTDGVLQDGHGLIDLWAGVQRPPLSEDRQKRMHTAYDRAIADTVIPDDPAPDPQTGKGPVLSATEDDDTPF